LRPTLPQPTLAQPMADFLEEYLGAKNDAFWGPYPAHGRSSHYNWAFGEERKRIDAQNHSTFSSFSSSASSASPYASPPIASVASPPFPSAHTPPQAEADAPSAQTTQQAQGPVYYTYSQYGSSGDRDGSGFAWAVGVIAVLFCSWYLVQNPDASATMLGALRDALAHPSQRAEPAPAWNTNDLPLSRPTPPPGADEALHESPQIAQEPAAMEALPYFDEPAVESGAEAPPTAQATTVPSLGIAIADETGATGGARIQAVAAGSPAASMGLAPGDVVTGLRYGDGRAPLTLTGAQDLVDAVPETMTVQEEFSLTIRRNGIAGFASRSRPAL
jgi:hypothetical protein